MAISAIAVPRPAGPRTGGPLLARNVLWNAGAEIAPLLIALVATPMLLRRLGTDRFGVLALAWTAFGFFGFLDLGLLSAIIKLASDRLGRGKEHEIPALLRTGQLMLTALGIFATILLLTTCHLLVHKYFKVPPALQAETQHAFYLMALSLPLVLGSRAYWGILASYQRFDRIAVIQSCKAVFLSLAPVSVTAVSNSLATIFAVLLAGHLCFWMVYCAVTWRILPSPRTSLRIDRACARELVGFGRYTAASSALNLLMSTFDRSALGMLVSLDAVAYYAAPQRIVARIRIIPHFFSGVLFPAFTESLAAGSERTALLFDRGVKCLIIVLIPATLFAVTFAPELLSVWLGTEFARHAAPAMEWLAIAALLAGVAELPQNLLAAADRPDINAVIAAIEIVPYFLRLRWFVARFGVSGAALAFALETGVHALLSWFAAILLMPRVANSSRRLAVALGGMLPALLLCSAANTIEAKCILFSISVAVFLSAAWFWLCAGEERLFVITYLRGLRSPAV